ncbi:hypothetical protein I2750_07700 [Bacillus sp. PR5]|nr:hypothetical protein [Bacillus sp. PR5]
MRSAKNGFHADRWRGSPHIESFLKRFQTEYREFGPLRRNVAMPFRRPSRVPVLLVWQLSIGA